MPNNDKTNSTMKKAGADDILFKPDYEEGLRSAIFFVKRFVLRENWLLTDGTTGLVDSKVIRERLGFYMKLHSIISVIMFDIDGFKSVNDTYGHLTGDWLLRRIAGRLLLVTRNETPVGRFGGDEFIVIMLGADKETALERAEDIRFKICSMPFLPEGVEINMTVSLGVATATKQNVPPEALLRTADEAMYQAKRDGKNCVRFAEILI